MCASVPTLKASADFQRISRINQKWFTPGFVVQIEKKETDAPFRVGFTVSRRVGNAVTRNLAKRRLREMVRLLLKEKDLRGFDLVLIGKTDAAVRDFAAMQKDLLWALKKLEISI